MIRNLLIKYDLIQFENLKLSMNKNDFKKIFNQKVEPVRDRFLGINNDFSFNKLKYKGYLENNSFKITFQTGANSRTKTSGVFCNGEIEEVEDSILLNLSFEPFFMTIVFSGLFFIFSIILFIFLLIYTKQYILIRY
jgi:hypothetical protein